MPVPHSRSNTLDSSVQSALHRDPRDTSSVSLDTETLRSFVTAIYIGVMSGDAPDELQSETLRKDLDTAQRIASRLTGDEPKINDNQSLTKEYLKAAAESLQGGNRAGMVNNLSKATTAALLASQEQQEIAAPGLAEYRRRLQEQMTRLEEAQDLEAEESPRKSLPGPSQ